MNLFSEKFKLKIYNKISKYNFIFDTIALEIMITNNMTEKLETSDRFRSYLLSKIFEIDMPNSR